VRPSSPRSPPSPPSRVVEGDEVADRHRQVGGIHLAERVGAGEILHPRDEERPFGEMDASDLPVTVGDLVALYDRAAARQAA
jgi:hypothetical protein